jgi:hypothetical protein
MIEGGSGYPVDGVKESISCELYQRMENISMKVAVRQALPCPPDARWHGREIPVGYAKVGVDEIVMGFHDMELDIAGPEDERTLREVLGGVILWDKNYIKLPGSAPRTTPPPSCLRSPTPPSPLRSPPHDYGHHNTSPSRSPPPDLGRPSPLPAAKETKRKRASKNAPSMSSKRQSPPKRKLSPLPKVPHLNLPIRPYDCTTEENARIAKEHYDAQMKKKEPEPRPEYTEEQKDYAKYLLTLPLQYDLHHKPNDYLRTLQKEGKRADDIQVQVGANQVQVQARKDQTFLSLDNRPNNRSHPSACYPRMFPLGCRGKVWK